MSTTIESLELQIQSSATSATTGIDSLSSSLSKLRNSIKGDIGLNGVVSQVRNLDTAVRSIDGSSADRVDRLANSLSKLSNLGKLRISASVGNQIRNIASATSSLNNVDFSSVGKLSSALKPLGNIESASGLKSTISQLKKLPEVATAMKSIDWATLDSQINKLTTSLVPLANQLSIVGNAFNNLPTKIQRLTNVSSKIAQTNNVASTSYVNLWAKFSMGIQAIRTGARAIGSCITQSNKYVEDLNLFVASMGEYAREAQNFAEKVSEAMGIDPAEWMRNQGVFNTIITGFGVASDRAYTMSKNLTQLGYDLSSFFNISYQDSMQKLSSGISGELEPLRRLGYDLSVARLQQEAYNLGINRSINSMTQAEKAQLRYYAIMTQVTVAQGDMARTLNAPANQLRVFHAQIIMASRAIGNIFIPALNAILPYAIAVVKVIRMVANAIASLFHFKLPKIDYSGVKRNVGGIAKGLGDAGTGAGNLGRGLGKAAKKAKELKNHLLGIDELNIISKDDNPIANALGGGAGGGGIGDVGGGDGLDFELPEYNFLEGLAENRVNKIFKGIKKHLTEILTTIGAIAAGFLSWKLSKGFLNSLSWISELRKTGLGAPLVIAIGITLLVTGLILEWSGIYDAVKKELDKFNFGQIVGGALLQSLAGFALGKGIATWIMSSFADSAIATALTTAATNLGVGTATTAGAIIGAGFMAIIAGIPMFFVGVHDAIKKGLNWLNGILIPLGSIMAGAGIGAVLGSCFGPLGIGIGALIGLAVGLVTDGIIAIIEHWSQITKFIKTFFTKTIPDIWDDFTRWVENLPEEIEKFFSDLWKPIKEYDWKGLGKDVGKRFAHALKSAFEFVTVSIPKWWENMKKTVSDGLDTLFSETLPNLGDTILNFFKNLPEAIFNAMVGQVKWYYDIGKAILDGIFEGLGTIWSSIKKFVKGFLDGFKEELGIHSPSTKFMKIGTLCIDGLLEGLSDSIKNIGEWVENHIIEPIEEAIKNNPISGIAIKIKNTSSDWWKKTKKWWKDASKGGVGLDATVRLVKEKWSTIKDWIGDIPILSQFIKLAKERWTTVRNWIGNIPTLSQFIKLAKEKWSTIKNWIGNIPVLSQFISLARKGWSKVTSWVQQFITGNVGQKISLVKGAWSSVSQWVRDRIGGSVTVAVNFAKGWVSSSLRKARKWLGLSTGGYITGSGIVHQFANGGIIGRSGISYFAGGTMNAASHGSMFVAGENGAEIVGHINGQTEVLNKSQISLAMKNAVISGMAQFAGYWRSINSQMVTCSNGIIRSILVSQDMVNSSIIASDTKGMVNRISSDIVNSTTQDVENGNDEEMTIAMREFYQRYVEPTLLQIASDTRKQAGKNGETVLQIGEREFARTAIETINNEQRIMGRTLLEV